MRKSTRYVVAALILSFHFMPGTASAQEIEEFYIFGGGTYNIPTGTFGDNDGIIINMPSTGFSQAGIGYRFGAILPISPAFAVFAESYTPKFSVDVDAVRAQHPYLSGNPDIPYDASYKIGVSGVGARFSPIELFMVKPYLQAGLSRYRLQIIQFISVSESSIRFEVSSSFNFGAGVMLPIGPFVIDAGASLHKVKLSNEGQPLGWDATWIDVGVKLLFKIDLKP